MLRLEKKCRACGLDKPMAAFSLDNTRKDLKQPYCRECQAARRVERLSRMEHVTPPDSKVCNSCEQAKPISGFHRSRNSPDGRVTYCKECVAESTRRWREANPERMRRNNLRHGSMSLEDYERMLASQDGKCAVCLTDTPGGRGRFHVDHDHECCPGARACDKCIRGLLCHRCNTALGLMDDDPRRLCAAIDYLELTRAAH